MKVCNNCKTTLADSASFCPNCGAQSLPQYPAYGQGQVKESISVGGWIGRSLIPCIPLVGGLVYLIMLFVWSGDDRKEDTFRNWAKAQLIVMAVVFVLTLLGTVLCMTVFREALMELM